MTEGNFEINSSDIEKAEEMAPQVLDSVETPEELDIQGQIESLEKQIETLESQYEMLDMNGPKIDALKRQLQGLKEKLSGTV